MLASFRMAATITGFALNRDPQDLSENTQNLVGAGLLAKAVCQATMVSTDTTLSRASPLPQGVVGVG
ncbi:hypothetical protein D9M71_849860 [compost metagenome]